MSNLVLIVEGHGDVASFPHLVGKIGAWLGDNLFSSRPIKSKGWGSVKKAGGLERWVGLALTRDQCKRIVVVVDLDDGCAVEESAAISARVAFLQTLHNVSIEVCFCIREFEAWFLRSADTLADLMPSQTDDQINNIIDNADVHRDAKGKLAGLLIDGYSPTLNQADLIARIDCSTLYERDRAFKKFVKAVSGLDYSALQAA